MTAPLYLGQIVTVIENGRERTGTVEAIRANGVSGVVRTTDGEILAIRADQVGVPAQSTMVSVDLAEAEGIAVAVLGGDRVPGSVTAQLLKLSAAFLILRNGRAA